MGPGARIQQADWRQGVDARLLQRLWLRAEQPGLIPLRLSRRILARMEALQRRLELLTRLVRRYTLAVGFGGDRVSIVHALWQTRAPLTEEESGRLVTGALAAVAAAPTSEGGVSPAPVQAQAKPVPERVVVKARPLPVPSFRIPLTQAHREASASVPRVTPSRRTPASARPVLETRAGTAGRTLPSHSLQPLSVHGPPASAEHPTAVAPLTPASPAQAGRPVTPALPPAGGVSLSPGLLLTGGMSLSPEGLPPADGGPLTPVLPAMRGEPVIPAIPSAGEVPVTPVLPPEGGGPLTPVLPAMGEVLTTPVLPSAGEVPVIPVVPDMGDVPVPPVLHTAPGVLLTSVLPAMGEVPISPVLPSSTAVPGALPSDAARMTPDPLVLVQPTGARPPGAATPGAPEPVLRAQPTDAAARGGVPAGVSRMSPGTSSQVGTPWGASSLPLTIPEPHSALPLVKPLPPAIAPRPDGPSPGGAPPARLRVSPLHLAEASAAGTPPGAPSPLLPRVVPHAPAGSGAVMTLVHPPRSPAPSAARISEGSLLPASRASSSMRPREGTEVRQGRTPPTAPVERGSKEDHAPARHPEIDMDALASKVRQRLVRQFAEEKVRRGGLK